MWSTSLSVISIPLLLLSLKFKQSPQLFVARYSLSIFFLSGEDEVDHTHNRRN